MVRVTRVAASIVIGLVMWLETADPDPDRTQLADRAALELRGLVSDAVRILT